MNFNELSNFIKRHTANEILENVSEVINMSFSELKVFQINNCVKDRDTYWHSITDLKMNIAHYDWLYEKLKEEISRKSLFNLLYYRVLPDDRFLEQAVNTEKPRDFNDNKKLVIDCGSSTTEDILYGLISIKHKIEDGYFDIVIPLSGSLSDIWEIPRLIYDINSSYMFFIRHSDRNSCSGTTIYAVSANNLEEGQLCNKENSEIGVYAPCPFVSKWTNQQLLKDCGLVPYMFHKVYGYNVTMVGVRHGEYPYLKQHLNGMKMEFFPDCTDDATLLKHQIDYIKSNYIAIDIMILNGPHYVYQKSIPIYKKLRPDGKVYIGLDANSNWMDRIDWRDPNFINLLDNCDVIATSCHSMQRHLSKKWPRWKIEFIPNGFFNSIGKEILVSPSDKENIILTVGRIGTDEKANHILLEAFAKVCDNIPDWKVHLVGSIDEKFNKYIDDYFNKYPHLKNRVLFKGLIESKEELFNEYKRAKIFILTSVMEGAPNVAAEAMMHGCYMITSSIDAASDITGDGKLGRVFPINDIDALAEIFLDVCPNEDMLHKIVPEVMLYAKNIFDWELIIKRIHHLMFEV